ncbi:MAG: acyltransferase [Muribaculaceae bacterium]
MRNKNYNIETLRGVAILLVVAGHVIGSNATGGMKIDYPSPLRYIYQWIDYIQLPLFTAIAGWVYALRPVTATNSIISFCKRKAIRLLIPMITVGTLYFLVQYVSPGTNYKGTLSEIWKIYIFPYTIYWYLPSLFLIFITIVIIDVNKWAINAKGLIICFCIAFTLAMLQVTHVIPDSLPNYFSFKGALLQLPYFLIGLGVCRFKHLFYSRSLLWIYALGTLIGIILLNIQWFYPNKIPTYIYTTFVIFTLPLLLNLQNKNSVLIWFGKYAYSIYLFHVFFTGGVRIILKMVGLNSQIAIFSIALLIAAMAPIFIDKLLSISNTSALFFLGKPKPINPQASKNSKFPIL